ncbi:hypothetical protein MUU53_23060 [Rhizobium lemnae]|uniref:Uncharacterized protein n=1 Tax=Rhizobium lemnae TaxID=1214924 RepID=A0ABV8E7P8_9HYPH|nr:hypothetical protein [Rhizobium lemnae]MCJ8510721.1 hypothetical protein [Rhizobium lemnae]
MSSNNNNGAGMAVAFAIAMLGIVGIFIFALLAFVAFVLTALAIFAWNSPLTLGKWTLHPHEARAFVTRGILGAFLVPAFLLFVNVFLNIHIEWNYLSYMLVGGYTLGSIGIEIIMADEQTVSAPPVTTYISPTPQLPASPKQAPQSMETEPFRFASWDDEEERG